MFLSSHHPAVQLKRAWRLIAIAAFFGMVISLGVSLLLPREYRADAQVLIIARSRSGVDPYTIAKSAERVGENIAAVMETDDFFQKVFAQTRYPIDRAYFENATDRVRRKRWTRAVNAQIVYGTGVLNVSAYGKMPESAKALASAVVDTLVAKGWEYVGGDVTIKAVNQPVARPFPARPNFVINLLIGSLLGALFASVAILRRG
jgi:capsular polysaccharide biosynthesis protein